MNSTVLMYHGIVAGPEDIPPDREVGAELYDVKLEMFQRHLEIIKDKDAVLTFDDGERNNFVHVFPLLKQHGRKAYFFVTAHLVGQKGYMNWEELRELRDDGMILGSHGLTHQILTELKQSELEKELYVSKDELEKNLMVNIECLSIPRGFCNEGIISTARDAGYKKIFVSAPQTNPENCIGRIAVKKDWSVQRFQQALEGKTPTAEAIFNEGKNAVKKVLGAGVYERVRGMILKKRST